MEKKSNFNEVRCEDCHRLLAKFNGFGSVTIQVKCRCGCLNTLDLSKKTVKKTLKN